MNSLGLGNSALRLTVLIGLFVFANVFLNSSASAQVTAGVDKEIVDKESRAVSAGDLFRIGEVQLNVYGIGGAGHGQRDVTDTHTETRTATRTVAVPQTVVTTTNVPTTVLQDIPGIPGLTPVQVNVPVTTTRTVSVNQAVKTRVKVIVKTTRNAAPIQGGFGGAGADASVFVTRNIGLGLEGEWIDGDSSIGDVMGTVTARFPIGSNAPYLFGGAGAQFGERSQAVGKLGGGVEHRFSPDVGMFADAAWMFSEHENAAVFRLGISIIFGPGGPTPGPGSSLTKD